MVPRKYLERCPECGEYRNGRRKVLCTCDGIPCSRCGKNRIHRPISEYYDERTGKIWHVPYFRYMLPCEECAVKGYVGKFGLEPALTVEDDSQFWAAAPGRCWPRPDERTELGEQDQLRFGAGREPGKSADAAAGAADARTGLRGSGSWWTDDLSDPDRPRVTVGGRGLLSENGTRPVLWLSVSRPSRGRDRALVFSGQTWGRLADEERTVRVWRKRVFNSLARSGEGGVVWEPTDEIVSAWVGSRTRRPLR